MRIWMHRIVFLLALVPLALFAGALAQKTYEMKHRDARSLVGRVSEELGDRGTLSVGAMGRSITIRDDPGNLERIVMLLEELDRPARRFAIRVGLDLFEKRRPASLFASDANFVDMTRWMEQTRPSARFDGHIDVSEGESRSAALGGDYSLQVAVAGYDPGRSRLRLRRLELWRRTGEGMESLLSGEASLPEGRITSVIMGETDSHPPFRLQVNPTLIPPGIEPEKEIP